MNTEANSISQTDWRASWAGSAARPVVEPVGDPIVLLDAPRLAAASGFAQDVGDNYPAPRPTPVASPAGVDGVVVESDGTNFGVFSSAREGWRGLTFDLPAGALADCTGLRFAVRSDEPYDRLVVRAVEALEPDATMGPMGPRQMTYATAVDLVGDGAWHEVTLPLFGDGFRGGAFQVGRPIDAAKVDRLVFVLPYHRPIAFELGAIYGIRAPRGDVPVAEIYPIVDVSDAYVDRGEERVNRSGVPELARYEDLSLKA